MVKSFLHLTAIIGFLITMPSPSIGTKKNKEEANSSLSNIGEMEIDLSSYCGGLSSRESFTYYTRPATMNCHYSYGFFLDTNYYLYGEFDFLGINYSYKGYDEIADNVYLLHYIGDGHVNLSTGLTTGYNSRSLSVGLSKEDTDGHRNNVDTTLGYSGVVEVTADYTGSWEHTGIMGESISITITDEEDIQEKDYIDKLLLMDVTYRNYIDICISGECSAYDAHYEYTRVVTNVCFGYLEF